jgi:hypothetical protein
MVHAKSLIANLWPYREVEKPEGRNFKSLGACPEGVNQNKPFLFFFCLFVVLGFELRPTP